MPTLEGPCPDCGKPTRRYVRPGRVLRCLDCGIARMARTVAAQATPGTPEHEAAAENGRRAAAEIRAGNTATAARWAAGMQEAARRKVAPTT